MAVHEPASGSNAAGGPPRHMGASCAFCGKEKEQAGPLVEARVAGVYICYACARLCAHVVEEECKVRGLPVPKW